MPTTHGARRGTPPPPPPPPPPSSSPSSSSRADSAFADTSDSHLFEALSRGSRDLAFVGSGSLSANPSRPRTTSATTRRLELACWIRFRVARAPPMETFRASTSFLEIEPVPQDDISSPDPSSYAAHRSRRRTRAFLREEARARPR
ncbi:hypothetical protein KM043_003118 [Ampulex compressa]|nr:hypothetical protein KM043_003118 [Ampulex compressa]